MQVDVAQVRSRTQQLRSAYARALQAGRGKSGSFSPPAAKTAAPFLQSEHSGLRARRAAAVLAARGALGGAIVCAFLIYFAGSAYAASLVATLILGCLAGWLARGRV